MGFMKKWEGWSQRQYDKWGSKLQPAYTKIDEWKAPDWAIKLSKSVWEVLDDEMKKKLYKFVMETCKNFDGEYAKALIQKLVALIKKRMNV